MSRCDTEDVRGSKYNSFFSSFSWIGPVVPSPKVKDLYHIIPCMTYVYLESYSTNQVHISIKMYHQDDQLLVSTPHAPIGTLFDIKKILFLIF